MSYLRPARHDEIVEFLRENLDLDTNALAYALAEMFDILVVSNTAT